jgi:Ca2+-binding RTX toxin-like protein
MQMRLISFHSLLYASLTITVVFTPALSGQTTPTCNGRAATIVASTPGAIYGTNGDDVIIGTAGEDKIYGLAGNDTICGLGGNDLISGGQGVDELFGGEGNDTFSWAPGDSSDRMEGSLGNDTLVFSGANVAEKLEFSANGSRVRIQRDIAGIVLDVAGIERVDCEARGGSDLIVVGSLADTEVQQLNLDLEGLENNNTPDAQPDAIVVFGRPNDDDITIAGSGNTLSITGGGPVISIRNPDASLDTLLVNGVGGNDRINAQNLIAGLLKLTIEGGPGTDTITGSRGSDVLVGGEDDDTFVWTLGSPADLITGGAGNDILQVLGSGVPDSVIVSASTLEAQVANTADGVTVQTDAEQILLRLGTGADQVSVKTASGARLSKITVDLRPSTTVSTGDGHPDTIAVNATTGADNITITGAAGSLAVSGVTPALEIQGSDYARDTLIVNGGPEADVVNAAGLGQDVIRLIVKGGQGSDTLTGSSGDDQFAWSPGDGSDILNGGPGYDTLQISGANIGENIGIGANGSNLRFTRDIGSVVLDAAAVERVTFSAMGGSDTILLADIGQTAVRQVVLDLAGPTSPAGDGLPDTISISAVTSDAIATTLGPGSMSMTWHGVRYSVTGVEPGSDRLTLQTAAAAPNMVSSVREEHTTQAEGFSYERQSEGACP